MVDLDELERLEAAATKGPFEGVCRAAGDDAIALAKIPRPDANGAVVPRWVKLTSADFKLFAAARNALPRLLAEARALRLVHRWASNVAFNFSQFPDRTEREDAMLRAFQDIEAEVKEALGDG